MTEPTKAEPTDTRDVSTSRVTTLETLVNTPDTKEAALEPAEKSAPEEHEEVKANKRSAQERIADLANKRREAEAKAEASEARARELEQRLARLEAANNTSTEQLARPNRTQYTTEDDYIDAVADWKLKSQRQQEQQQRINVETQEIEAVFLSRLHKTRAEIDDFDDIVGNASVNVPDFLIMAIKESDQGPLLTYYLAKNQDEARRIAAMRPVRAIKALADLERELAAESEPSSKPEPKKRAPEPITPVRGTSTSNPGPAPDFASYKQRRQDAKKR